MLSTRIFHLLQSLFGFIWEKTRQTHSFCKYQSHNPSSPYRRKRGYMRGNKRLLHGILKQPLEFFQAQDSRSLLQLSSFRKVLIEPRVTPSATSVKIPKQGLFHRQKFLFSIWLSVSAFILEEVFLRNQTRSVREDQRAARAISDLS